MNKAVDVFDVVATNHAMRAIGMPGTIKSHSTIPGTVTNFESGCLATTYATTKMTATISMILIADHHSTADARELHN